jgi:hypothetical protein
MFISFPIEDGYSIFLTSELAFILLSLELNVLNEFSELSICCGLIGAGGGVYNLFGGIQDCFLQLIKMLLLLVDLRNFLVLLIFLVIYHWRVFRADVGALRLIHSLNFYAWSLTTSKLQV